MSRETLTLARFLTGLDQSSLPEEVVNTAKLSLLDTIGVMVGAISLEWTDIVRQHVLADPGRSDCSIVGSDTLVSSQSAAMVNSTAAHGIEMDDRLPRARVHPGAYTIPPALAVCERDRLDGGRLVEAIVGGYELGIRVGLTAMFPAGFHRSGHRGVWFAVAAAATAAGLSSSVTENALGIAGSMAAGLNEFSEDPQRTMIKRVHAGFAARNGVCAVDLAQRGLTAPRTVLEGTYGYCRVTSGDVDTDQLVEGLGTHFLILERELKPYAAWGGGHTALDAVREILNRRPLAVDEIAGVHVAGSSMLVTTHELAHPTSVMAAQYSLPYLVAVGLTENPDVLIDPRWYSVESRWADPSILELAGRIELSIDENLEQISVSEGTYGGAKVTVDLSDGSSVSSTVMHSRGTVRNPMSEADIIDKFRLLAMDLGPARVDRIVALVLDIENVADVGALACELRSA